MRRDSDDSEDRFISGVFNYCDRWCEHCRFQDRCRVRHEEREQMARHLLLGENASDPDVLMADVQASLDEAMSMLEEMAEDDDTDLDELDDLDDLPEFPDTHRDAREDELSQRADRWGNRLERFLEAVREAMPDLAPELTRQVEELPLAAERAGEETLARLQAARGAYEVLHYFRYFIVVKTMRAVGGMDRATDRAGRAGELFEALSHDALGTAKLLAESLARCEAALWDLAEFNPPWQAEALPLAADAQGMREALGERFPGYEDFVRPGFDEEDDLTSS